MIIYFSNLIRTRERPFLLGQETKIDLTVITLSIFITVKIFYKTANWFSALRGPWRLLVRSGDPGLYRLEWMAHLFAKFHLS